MAKESLFAVDLRFCNGVALLQADAKADGLKWIHLATVGEYLGHWQGPFKLTHKSLEEIVRNFQSDERYSADESTGLGTKPVVPFDYEHASEQSPTMGDIPSNGTPAPAWAVEMELRSSADGTQLWALTKLGDKVRAQIEAGEYLFVSMAFTNKGVDQRTGKAIGHLITSIAFTNQPFLTGIEAIAAKARETGAAVVLRFDGGGPPTLATIPALAQPGADGVQPSKSTEAPVGHRAPDIGDQMTTELSSLGKLLAGKLTQAGLNKGRLLQTDDDVGEAVAEAITSNGDLSSLLEGLGVTNAEQALANIAELKSAAAKIDTLSAELKDALSGLEQAQGAEADVEVEQVMAAKQFDPSAKVALLGHRKMLTKEHGHEEGSKKFLENYGVTHETVEKSKAHLLQLHVAAKDGKQLQASPRSSDGDGADVIDLASFAGRNTTEKIIAHCSAKDPNFKNQPWGAQVNHAAELRRTAKIVNG